MIHISNTLRSGPIRSVCYLCMEEIGPYIVHVEEHSQRISAPRNMDVLRKSHLTCFDMKQHGHAFDPITKTQIKTKF